MLACTSGCLKHHVISKAQAQRQMQPYQQTSRRNCFTLLPSGFSLFSGAVEDPQSEAGGAGLLLVA